MAEKGNGDGIKMKLIDWLLRQGVATVMLFAMIGSGIYVARWAVPAGISEFKSWHNDQEERHRKERETVTNAVKDLASSVRDQTTVTKDLIKEIQKH